MGRKESVPGYLMLLVFGNGLYYRMIKMTRDVNGGGRLLVVCAQYLYIGGRVQTDRERRSSRVVR